jgi:hypothetical protein
MRVKHFHSRYLPGMGLGVVIGVLACLGLRMGGNAKGPVAPAMTTAPAPAADHPGIVCRSAHFTLTAEIHAGS